MKINYKKWLSLIIAILVVLLVLPLIQSDVPASHFSRQNQQSDRHVRKWGESAFTGFGTSVEAKRVEPATERKEASNAKK